MTTKYRSLPVVLLVVAALVCVPAYGQLREREVQKLLAADAEDSDFFGYAVALDGDTAVIGTPHRWDQVSETNGVAYIFTRSDGVWSEQAKLIASDKADYDQFGWSVALDGDTAIIGTPDRHDSDTEFSGAAYIFTRSGTVWSEQAKLLASDKADYDRFGWSVALDGGTAVIGLRDGEVAYVFVQSGGIWIEQARLLASDTPDYDRTRFGRSVAIDGDTAVIGAPIKSPGGAAYVFTRSSGIWTEQAKLLASDQARWARFGSSVVIDGDTAVIGDPERDDSGMNAIGAAYVFTRSGGVWTEQAKLLSSDKASVDKFGGSLSLADDLLVIGADTESDLGTSWNGAAYVFVRSGGVWSEQLKLLASDKATGDYFGTSVAVDGDTAIVGAPEEDDGGNFDNGAAYVYNLDGLPRTTFRLEAEDMELDTYRVEELNFASNGALINLKGPGLNGSATTTFPGMDGQYDVSVVYHDENDGEALLSLSIAGVSVDSWTLDYRSSESQPAEANRLTRQIARGLTLNYGDTIRIDGVQGNWDHANVDYIEFAVAQPQPTDTVRVEAEAMDLDTYRVEMLDFASNGALINLKGPGLNGSATTAFPGSSGKYDVVVVYHDENDGLAQLTVSIAGVSLDSWILDQSVPGGEQPQDYNRFSRQIATDLTVNNGDTIRIDGLQGNWDHANVDYIDFVVKGPPQTTVQIEAEDMQLDTYKIEMLDFASDGALINLKGPGLNGSATTAFPGNSGKYDITVVYHDENDGVAQLTVSIAGASVDSWLLDFISTEAQPKPANRRVREIATAYTVNNDDEIRIDGLQGNWDHANVDYIKFVLAQ